MIPVYWEASRRLGNIPYKCRFFALLLNNQSVMWYQLGRWILKNRLWMLLLVLASTGVMTFFASKVQLSYEFAKAIPVNHPKYKEYVAFKQQFGEDGNLLVMGFENKSIFEASFFNDFVQLQKNIRQVPGVEDVLSISSMVELVKDSASEKLKAVPVFADMILSQSAIDSAIVKMEQLPFFKNLLYNPQTNVYTIGVRINKEVLNSKKRNAVVAGINQLAEAFEAKHKIDIHLSGLPLVRTVMSTRIADEMKLFLLGSVLLSAVILLLFFRSFSAMWLSMAVVVMGVIWSLATMVLFGYRLPCSTP